MTRRICVIGTPRSGSQYVLRVLQKSISQHTGNAVFDMLEPFTKDAQYIPLLNKDKSKIINHKITSDIEYAERVTRVLDTIQNCNPETDIVIKIFPYEYIHEYLPKILTILQNQGFMFIKLKRDDIEAQLLSWVIAKETNVWSVTHIDVLLNQDPVGFKSANGLVYVYNFIKSFDSICNKFGISGPTIHYETAVSDLYKVLQIPISTNIDLIKQGTTNPYKFIINKEELRKLIKELLDGNEIY